jgi:RNA ligase (TIGR02306 family)
MVLPYLQYYDILGERKGGNMSTLLVTTERLTIRPHPNADSLELARVGLYEAVVGKGTYQTGDYAVYIPEGAILPEDLIAELNLTGRLAGKAKNRIKAIRLRGELSQGIVCSPLSLAGRDLESLHGVNLAKELGIIKWIPEVPVHMSGVAEAAPDMLKWIEIENLKRFPDVFEVGEQVIATEKVHGTCFCLSSVGGETFISSKGMAEQGLALVKDENNLYWSAAIAHNLPEIANRIAHNFDATRVAIYGEVYGAGVQDLHYGKSAKQGKPGFVVFDIRIELAGELAWVAADLLPLLASQYGLPTAPILYSGPFDLEALTLVASGLETISGTGAHIREGIVIRPARNRDSSVLKGRAIAKLVSDDYLTRSGGTEYQ